MGNFLQESSLPHIFFEKSKTLPPVVGTISTLTVKKASLGLQNPVTSAADKYTSSICASYNMIGTVTDEMYFSTADQLLEVKEERRYGKRDWDDANDTKLRGIVNDQGNFEKRLFLCAKHTGSWTIIQGTMVTGTVLAAT